MAGPVTPAESRYLPAFRVASFVLGAAVIVDALITHAAVIQWVAGLVLAGVVPPEAIARAWRRSR